MNNDNIKTFPLFTNRVSCEITPFCLNVFLQDKMEIFEICCPEPRRNDVNKAIQLDFSAPVQAVAYNKESPFTVDGIKGFVMFRKQDRAYRNVKETVESSFDKLVVLKINVIEKIKNDKEFKFILCQLLCSYAVTKDSLLFPDANTDKYSNILGKMYFFLPYPSKGWNRRWKDKSVRKDSNGKVIWNGNWFKDSPIRVGLAFSFTPDGILKAKATPFVELQRGKGKLLKKNGYILSVNGFRKSTAQDKGNLFYQQGEPDTPSHIPFFKFSSWKDLDASKTVHIWNFMKEVNSFKEDGQTLVSLKPWNYGKTKIFSLETLAKKKDLFFDYIIKDMRQKICFRTFHKTSSKSEVDENKVDMKVREWLANRSLLVSDALNKAKVPGIFLFHGRDEYKNKEKDTRIIYSKEHPENTIQEITYEALAGTLSSNKEKETNSAFEMMMKNSIITLFVKWNIREAAVKDHSVLRGLPVRDYGIQEPVYFAMRFHEDTDDRFFVLGIDPSYNTLKIDNFTYSQRYLYKWGNVIAESFMKDYRGDTGDFNGNAEFITFKKPDDIYLFTKTEERLLPSEEACDKVKASDKRIDKDILIRWVGEFSNKVEEEGLMDENYHKYIERIRYNFEGIEGSIDLKGVQSLINLSEIINGKRKSTFKKQYNKFRDFCKEKGIRFGTSYIRSLPEFSSKGWFRGGWWFKTPDYINGSGVVRNSITYFIALNNTMQQGGLDKGIVLRNITRLNGQEADMKFIRGLLSMCAVDFVKMGGWSVMPFPLKYIREYQELSVIDKKLISFKGGFLFQG